MTNIILSVILILLTIVLNQLFLGIFFHRKEYSIKHLMIMVAFLVFSVQISHFLSSVFPLRIILNLAAYVLVGMWVFQISFKKSLVSNLVFVGIYVSAEFVGLIVLQRIVGKDYSDVTNVNGAFIAEIICQFVVLLIILLLNAIFKNSDLSAMDIKGWIIFALFPVISLFSEVVLIYGTMRKDGRYINENLIVGLCMLILNILLFFLLDNVIRREKKLREKEVLLAQTEHLSLMYKSLSEEREQRKARMHDYINNLNTILMLAESGEIERETEFIHELIGNEVRCIDIIDTGNPMINAVINIKYNEAKQKGVLFPLIADNLSDIKVSDSDIVTIISNVLDNAIEAAQNSMDKKTVFKIRKSENELLIDSMNSFSGELLFCDHILKSTKKDVSNHGYGLANIMRTVEKYNGVCFTEVKNGMFHLVISMPLV